MDPITIQSSYRDPSGHVFPRGGLIFRQVNLAYKEHYDLLMGSGLYDALVEPGLLVRHQEVDLEEAGAPGTYKVLKPEPVRFVSYPYEWSFSQLKAAALTTLEILKIALQYGMTLKDSSAYNIQWLQGRPVLIDTLSFEKYREGAPWVGYRQFCQHFLAPLALMSYRHIDLGRLLRVNIDGIPLEVAHSLLPIRTRFKPSLQIHIHLHSRFQRKISGKPDTKIKQVSSFKLRAFLGLIDSLESAVRKLQWKPAGTEWGDYRADDSYASTGLDHKIELVTGFIRDVSPATVWDLGANTGRFSQIAAGMGIETISFDMDPAAVEKNYLSSVDRKDTKLLPLLWDLTNPSPKIGWANRERMDLEERGPAEMVLALALIHHLAIGANVPLGMIAEYFRKLCNWAVVEFVPKSDVQVARLLATREDVFPRYTQEDFEAEFGAYFEIQSADRIVNSERTLYLMRGK